MKRLSFNAGLEKSELIKKVLEYLQTKADATAEDIQTLIQQREQTIKFVKNEPEGTTETVAFASKNKSKRNFSAKPTNKKEVSETFDCTKSGKSHNRSRVPHSEKHATNAISRTTLRTYVKQKRTSTTPKM